MDKSNYFNTLPKEVQARYCEKLQLINRVDPYLLKFNQCSTKIDDFPKVSYFDILQYLVFKKSAYTDKEFRAYKSLDAYQFFLAKWVKKLAVKPVTNSNRILVLSQVMHSQRLNLPPLNTWILCDKEGEILFGHCDCVAGLAECCSHIGATLFAIEDAVRNCEVLSVTDKKAYWMAPSESLGLPAKVSEVDYTVRPENPLDFTAEDIDSNSVDLQGPTQPEKDAFLNNLFKCDKKSAILSMFSPYAEEMDQENKSMKGVLDNLYKEEYRQSDLPSLINLGKKVNLKVNIEQVEQSTRGQSKSNLWFRYRSGRITASNFKSVCNTSLTDPSLSLLKKICYPKENTFRSVYTDYGCQHEKKALQNFVSQIKCAHENFKDWRVGFMISQNRPCFGASPNLMVSCTCCGKGSVEVKCPYCVKDQSIEGILNKKSSFLKEAGGKMYLDRNHTYHYQVQMQMAVTGVKYSYFVVWSEKDLFYERISFDEHFWQENSEKAYLFHEKVVFPELLAKFYTSKIKNKKETALVPVLEKKLISGGVLGPERMNAPGPSTSQDSTADVRWCTCKQKQIQNKMVCCDNYFCDIKWFHLSCVKLKSVPKVPWYCKKCSTVNLTKKL